MPPTAEIEFKNSSCLIHCTSDCSCTPKNELDVISKSEFSSDVSEIIGKGHNDLATALRSLRWSKSKTLLFNNDETVIQKEKCRSIISLKEVADHDSCDDCWIVLYDRVYDVTNFLNEHPGGSDVIIDYAGRDASIAFRGHSQYALKSLKNYEIGELPEKERIYRRPGLLRCDELPE